MKSFTALLLLAAFAVHVFSNEVAIYRASYNFITEQQDLKMAEAVRDNGLTETTLIANDHEEPPDFLVSEPAPRLVRNLSFIATVNPCKIETFLVYVIKSN